MSFDLEYIDRLIAQEIAGTISPENKVLLEQAKDAEVKVRKLWEARNSLFESREMKEWLNKERKFDPLAEDPLAEKKRPYFITKRRPWLHGKPQPLFDVRNLKPNKLKTFVISVLIVIFLSFLVFWFMKL